MSDTVEKLPSGNPTLIDKYTAELNLRKMLHAWKFWGELGPALRKDLVEAIDWTYRSFRQPLRKEHPLWRINLLCEQQELYTKQELVEAIRRICSEE